jgi:hypothetical protein
VRLDRAVANSNWCDIYRETDVFVLAAQASDHNPLLINFEKEVQLYGGGKWGFKFEDRWWLDEDCGNIIRSAWEQSSLLEGPMQAVCSNLERCQTWLKSWNRRKYCNMEKMVKHKSKELLQLQQHGSKRRLRNCSWKLISYWSMEILGGNRELNNIGIRKGTEIHHFSCLDDPSKKDQSNKEGVR